MYNIKTLNKISEAGIEKFNKTKYFCSSTLETPDAIIVRSASMHNIELPDSVIAVARAGAGTNNIPVDEYTEKGIVVFNTPGANANAVKELVILGMLISSRKVKQAIEWCENIKEDNIESIIEKEKSTFSGPEIKGKTLGIIGYGAIGRLVAEAAVDLGMNVLAYDPFLPNNSKIKHGVTVTENIEKIFSVSDYLSLHAPLNESTEELICKSTIGLMKNSVRILNFARGELVNSTDISDALKDKRIAAYVTDFPNSQLIGVDGVIAIPHLGASTPESEENCAVLSALELIDFLENGNIKNSVNMPTVSMTKTGKARVTVIHKNQAKMISTITDTISRNEINIASFKNKSKGTIAYSIIDCDSNVPSKVLADIESINAVIKVRLIK